MPTFLNFVIFVLALTTVMKKTSSFFMDELTCPAYKPCTCTDNYVNCQYKSLTEMPNLYPSNITGSTMHIYLYGNQLTTIPADAFRNLTVSNDTKISLEFQSNHLNSIATNAFRGIRDTQLDYLHLRNNNFTSLPSELGTLRNINELDLRLNPLSYLNPSTMHQLGRSLKKMNIDLNHFNGWPVEFSSLISLEGLFVRYLNTNHLDDNVFDAFANSLTTLHIEYSQLEKVPVAICHLKKLQSLTFENNNNIHVNSTVLEPCSTNLTSVTNVEFQENQLRYMPDVFRLFPSMTTLNLDYNKLSDIHWDTVPSNAPLTILQIDRNDFTRIPLVVRKLYALTQLNVRTNKIKSIGDSDLNNLARLQYIDLSNNPIEYISPHAFQTNLMLSRIRLTSTKLHRLPNSLRALQNLQVLYLDGSPIECSCAMSFLKPLRALEIYIYGTCKSSSIQIKSYIIDDLQKCP